MLPGNLGKKGNEMYYRALAIKLRSQASLPTAQNFSWAQLLCKELLMGALHRECSDRDAGGREVIFTAPAAL